MSMSITEFRRQLPPGASHFHPETFGSKKLQVIGVIHGTEGGSVLFPPHHSYLEAILSGYKGKLFTEGKPRYFVPFELEEKAKVIEPPEIENLTKTAIKDLSFLSYASMYGLTDAKETALLKHARYVYQDKVNAPVNRIQSRARIRHDADRLKLPYPNKAHAFIVNVRSLIMAGELLHQTNYGRNKATLIVGSNHAIQINNFIERPALALKYLQVVRKKFIEQKLGEALPVLDRAERAFKHLQTRK